MSHTREPWFSQYDDNGFYEIGSESTSLRVAFTHGEHDTAEANARRICAAVNACEGIPTVALEMDKPTFVAMLLQRQTLQLQKRELIDALKLVTDELEQLHNHYYRDCEGRNCPAGKYIEQARSVMAMVSDASGAKHPRCEKQCQEAITCPAGKCALNDAATNDRYPIPDFLRKHRD